MTDKFTLVEKALFSALSANSNLSPLVGTNIFDTQAPQGTTGDYIIFQLTAGGNTNDSPRDVVDVFYRVEYISQAQNNARVGSGYIDDTLHNKELSPGLAGWTNYRSRNTRLFNQVENHDGRQWFRKGGFYRIQLSKQG